MLALASINLLTDTNLWIPNSLFASKKALILFSIFFFESTCENFWDEFAFLVFLVKPVAFLLLVFFSGLAAFSVEVALATTDSSFLISDINFLSFLVFTSTRRKNPYISHICPIIIFIKTKMRKLLILKFWI